LPSWLFRNRQPPSNKNKLILTSRKKWTTDGTSRVKPVQETLEKVTPIAKRIGVTRIADITHMDRLYIPNFSTVLPGTEDKIWVYSGKGPTRDHAKASAIMESIERYSSLPSTDSSRNIIVGSLQELSKNHTVLHPDELVEPLRIQYRNDMVMEFMVGTELFTNTEILVPASLALFEYRRPITKTLPSSQVVNPFGYTHTSGLASGNVIEEAVCHALCELIERDASSIAQLYSTVIPYTILQKVAETLIENGYPITVGGNHNNNCIADKFIDDASVFPDVDISEVDSTAVTDLVKKFHQADLPLLIKNITSDIAVPTFYASSYEELSEDYGLFAVGYGSHPDARIALIRAITELSQTRAANVHGARDDLKKIRFNLHDENAGVMSRWHFKESRDKISFSEVKSYYNNDLLDDIKLILNNLKEAGLRRVIIVDLTNKNIGIPVVRAIVPGLETYTVTESVMSRRAKSFFKKNIGKINYPNFTT
jgi:ribosomal protein S12 methylthiotransferase accessory factor